MKLKQTIKLIINAISQYSFQCKEYPYHLYNIYGSEGHSPDRQYVDNLIKKNGFWWAVVIITNNVNYEDKTD